MKIIIFHRNVNFKFDVSVSCAAACTIFLTSIAQHPFIRQALEVQANDVILSDLICFLIVR